MYNDRILYRVSYQMTEDIYQEANHLLYRKRMPGRVPVSGFPAGSR